MFKRVENEWELSMFNTIWTTVWQEKGYELEYADHALARFVVITTDGQYVGTSEIKPYSLCSTIHTAAPFHSHTRVAMDPERVAEIDKIALLPEHRGKHISTLLSSAVHVAEELGLTTFISLLEPVFYRALRITFHVPMERIGEKVFYKGDYVIPVLFHMDEMYHNKDKYDWLVLPQDHAVAL
ncbi:GNAT family N-acetyltransferase [Paenibacillus sp. GCM10023252]|uniref:GNAT family N-acetyltransferase n=1 Tax=Paenibacillus sp. GCM10023252 TaxID=3252649 RepID=UPI0036087DD9